MAHKEKHATRRHARANIEGGSRSQADLCRHTMSQTRHNHTVMARERYGPARLATQAVRLREPCLERTLCLPAQNVAAQARIDHTFLRQASIAVLYECQCACCCACCAGGGGGCRQPDHVKRQDPSGTGPCLLPAPLALTCSVRSLFSCVLCAHTARKASRPGQGDDIDTSRT